jgi:hypothetical protein
MDGPVETRHALSQLNNDKAGILRNEIRSIQRGIAGRIEQGCPQGWRGLAREVRRRPWEPPQTRWASPPPNADYLRKPDCPPTQKTPKSKKKKGGRSPLIKSVSINSI